MAIEASDSDEGVDGEAEVEVFAAACCSGVAGWWWAGAGSGAEWWWGDDSAVGAAEREVAVAVDVDGVAVAVEQAVMFGAEQHQVVDVGGSEVIPRHDVMGLDEAEDGAAREPAAAVAAA